MLAGWRFGVDGESGEGPKSGEGLAEVLDVSSAAVYVVGPDHRLTYANPAACELFGVPAGSLNGTALADLPVVVEEVAVQAASHDEVVARGRPLEQIEAHTVPGLARRWLRTTRTPVPAPGGGWSVLVVAVEISATMAILVEARAAAERAEASQQLLARAEELAGLGSVTHDLRSGNVSFSPGMRRLAGLDGFELPEVMSIEDEGDLFARLVHPDDREAMVAARDAAFAGEDVRPLQVRARTADDQVRYRTVRVAVERDGRGNPVRVSSTVLDVTEAVRIREALARSLARQEAVVALAHEVLLQGSDGVDERLLGDLGAVFGLDGAGVFSVEESRIDPVSLWLRPGAPLPERPEPVSLGSPGLRHLATGEPFIFLGENTFSEEWSGEVGWIQRQGIGFVVVVPVRRAGLLRGLVAFWSAGSGSERDSAEVDLLVLAGGLVARAAEAVYRGEQVAGLGELADSLGRLTRLLPEVRRAVEQVRLTLIQVDGRGREVVSGDGDREAIEGSGVGFGPAGPAVGGASFGSLGAVLRRLEDLAREIEASERQRVSVPSDVEARLSALPGVEALSEREREVLGMLALGLRVPTIANRLYVSQSTVRNHVSRILRKTGVRSQAELIERLV